MSNIIHEDKFYNENIKEEYLNTLKKGTRQILNRIFKISYQMEIELGKDLYEFNREELRKLFYTFSCSTAVASKSTVQYVIGYIEWAIDEEYTNKLNPLSSVDVTWKEQFAVRPEKKYLTDAEIKTILKKLVNAQDAVVLYAPFLGIVGNENAEITNLKGKNINSDELSVKVIDSDHSERIVKVDEEFVRLCKLAIKEDEYIKSNGSPDRNVKSETNELISNDYVVRSSNTRIKYTEEADKNIVYRRYATISKYFNEMNLTPTNVAYSGMLAMAKNLYLDDKLDEDGYKLIASQFKLNDHALQRVRLEFLNEEEVKKLYKIT